MDGKGRDSEGGQTKTGRRLAIVWSLTLLQIVV